MSAPLAGNYGVAGTSPLRDITSMPYMLLSDYIQSTWNSTLAYGIDVGDVDFDVSPDINNGKNKLIVHFSPTQTPIGEDMDIYEKFSQEGHLVTVEMFVKDDADRPTNRYPDKMIDLWRYMKKALKTGKAGVVDVENIMLLGEGPMPREDLSEWYGYSIDVGLLVFMVTTQF